MAQASLTLETLGEVGDGSAGAIINAALNAAVADLEDRGDDKQKRKVTITVTLAKVGEHMTVNVDAAPKVPAYKSRTTVGTTRTRNGRPVILFQEYAPNEPHQRTMDEAEAVGAS